jgi:DNA/RNA-binding domain of Phe-tRNA-synthetase-like protein
MTRFPPTVAHQLEGWELFWADLELGDAQGADTAELRREAGERARASHAIDRLADHATASAVRRLFRRAGCDPTRYRPSSEALLRRVLKGGELPAIHPFVDVNNCLSVELVVPACVADVERVAAPFALRAGRAGESMVSMRGPFELEGKPLLADQQGPFGTPITDSERVKVRSTTRRVWLVAYLPAGVVTADCASAALASLCGRCGGVEVNAVEATS